MGTHPVLYSYRRCPYAMRARMAIWASGIQVEQREIVFWDKPQSMMAASPKGTVPVLILPDGQVIDESLDIMLWALKQSDPQGWLRNEFGLESIMHWIERCDHEFKPHLDCYKYADQHPEFPQEVYRKQGEGFLQAIETVLQPAGKSDALSSIFKGKVTLADIAIVPFVRQFANVDKGWFANANYPLLRHWLESHLRSDYFLGVMKNRPVWQPHHQPLWVLEPSLHTRNEFLKVAQIGR